MIDASLLEKLHVMLDKDAIRDSIARFSHGIDRIDRDALERAFWRDGNDDHFFYAGPVPDFIEWVAGVLEMMDQTFHMLGQSMISVTGDRAEAETYTFAYHRLGGERLGDGGPAGHFYDLALGARYVDKLEKRDGEWRILDRHTIYDWFRVFEDSFDPVDGFLGQGNVRTGKRVPDDPVYTRLTARF